MQSTNIPNSPRGRKKFLLIAAIFFVPMVLAWISYFGPASWHPSGTTNNGELITPAIPLELGEIAMLDQDAAVDPWQEKWTLLQVWQGDCGEECAQRVHDMRQLRKSLHRRRERVQRVILLPSRAEAEAMQAKFQEAHALLRFGVLSKAKHAELVQLINRDEPLTVAIVDPLGNYLMRYVPATGLRGMYKDIMRLLKLSNIG